MVVLRCALDGHSQQRPDVPGGHNLQALILAASLIVHTTASCTTIVGLVNPLRKYTLAVHINTSIQDCYHRDSFKLLVAM